MGKRPRKTCANGVCIFAMASLILAVFFQPGWLSGRHCLPSRWECCLNCFVRCGVIASICVGSPSTFEAVWYWLLKYACRISFHGIGFFLRGY
jgi:hypothetical protein